MFRHSQKCACQVKGCICCWLYCIYCVVRRVFIIKTNTCNFFLSKRRETTMIVVNKMWTACALWHWITTNSFFSVWCNVLNTFCCGLSTLFIIKYRDEDDDDDNNDISKNIKTCMMKLYFLQSAMTIYTIFFFEKFVDSFVSHRSSIGITRK